MSTGGHFWGQVGPKRGRPGQIGSYLGAIGSNGPRVGRNLRASGDFSGSLRHGVGPFYKTGFRGFPAPDPEKGVFKNGVKN